MLLTVICIVVALGSLVVVGLPVAWILNGRRPLTELGWVKVPFLGLTTIVLVLQNLVYLDVPIRWSAPFVWGAAGLLWVWLFRSGQLRISFARLPRALYLACVLVYLLHGLGLLLVGARYYVGRCWTDEYNYTVTAQSFMEKQYVVPVRDVGSRPDLVRAWFPSHSDRIGAEIVQGFFAVSSGADAKTLFEPTILVGVVLVVLAIYALCRHLRLARGPALATALAAGLLPGLALMHLESFLSQALATPLLLYLPAGLSDVCQRPRWGRIAGLGLILAGGTAIYAEYWLIFLGLTVLMVGLAAVRRRWRWRLLGCGLALAAAPGLCNPGFVVVLLQIQRVLTASNYPWMPRVYPWAFQAEGLTHVWVGPLFGGRFQLGPGFARVCGLGLTTLGYLGLLNAFRRQAGASRASGWEPRRWRALTLTAGILALALLPLAVLARDDKHPYQFYKLLLTMSPLLAVGLALLCQNLLPGAATHGRAQIATGSPRWRLGITVLLLGAVAFLGASGTCRMAVRSSFLQVYERCNAGLFLAADMREAQDRLATLRNRDVLIAAPYSPPQEFLAGWLAYFARGNRVLLGHPMINDLDVEQVGNPGGVFLAVGPRTLPEGLLLLTSKGTFHPGTEGSSRLLWGNNTYELWEPGPGPWAVPLRESRLEPGPGAPTPSPSASDISITRLDVLASAPGAILLSRAGPRASLAAVRLRIETSDGYASEAAFPGAGEVLSVPVVAGRNVITLAPRGGVERSALPAAVPPLTRVDVPQPQFQVTFLPTATNN